ncbi:MAG: aryl-sulfate sulfotransferase [Bacteroidota bacterium]|nr:aryl-sulfate sulfotransferase [Bacteroidota bacterium]MDP4289193.1 aryl-sulfate sulfotransferase [Bacteroidota bacterium]
MSLLILLATPGMAQRSSTLNVQYQFPSRGATAIPRQTNIIIRPGDSINRSTVKASLLKVTGTFSGTHAGTFVLSDDKKTLVFTSKLAFTYSERVRVSLARGIRTTGGKLVDSLWFYFTIQSKPLTGHSQIQSVSSLEFAPDAAMAPGAVPIPFLPSMVQDDSLPFFPKLTMTTIDNPSAGSIFIATFNSAQAPTPYIPYLAIINDSGRVLWSRAGDSRMTDFKLNPNGQFSFYRDATFRYYVMDSTFTIVDSFWAKNGYATDLHDIVLLPNHHALLMAYDTEQKIDLSQYVMGGNTNANVIGVVIQELDSAKNVIFNWRSFDSGNFSVPEMVEYPHGLAQQNIDEVHANSLDIDTDGTILLSARHLDEITKISRDSNRIVWRWGGNRNEFTIIGDTIGFSHQHHVRRIANGHITIFDNGNDHRLHNPNAANYSRALEYALDEKAKTATLVWSYDEGRRDTSTYMGDVQRLPNGNTFIGWGGDNILSTRNPAFTEVHSDGSIALEMDMQQPYLTYRAFKFPWTPPASFAGVIPHYLSDIPESAVLGDVYPNPAMKLTTISIALPHEMSADLRIFDALGHEAAVVVSGWLQAGPHAFTVDVSALQNGLYLCVLRTGEGTFTKRIEIAK